MKSMGNSKELFKDVNKNIYYIYHISQIESLSTIFDVPPYVI